MNKFIRKIVIICILAMAVLFTGFAYDENAVAQCDKNMDIAHEMAECARALGYAEDHVIIRTASDRWWQEYYKKQDIINADKVDPVVIEEDVPVVTMYVTDQQMAEYPVASQVWQFLKADMGLSDACAAGILGNMMAECGGQTLDLQPYIYGYGYYGLCMWYLEYTNGALYWGSSVEDQLAHLKNTCAWAMEYWGASYDYFCSIGNAYDAAWYFTQYYERGAWADIRGWNAIDAYNYFAK